MGALFTFALGGVEAQWIFARIAAAANLVANFMTMETLPKAARLPLKLAGANPFSNTMILFRNGAGLRRLAFSRIAEASCQMVFNASARPYRFGPLGWSPENEVVYKQTMACTSMVNRLFFLVRISSSSQPLPPPPTADGRWVPAGAVPQVGWEPQGV